MNSFEKKKNARGKKKNSNETNYHLRFCGMRYAVKLKYVRTSTIGADLTILLCTIQKQFKSHGN